MIRPRRNRRTKAIRNLLEEYILTPHDLIQPVFVHDQLEPADINALPGQQRYDQLTLLKHCETLLKSGISAIALFPAIDESKKTSLCQEALNEDNLMCQVTRRLKKTFGDDLVIVGDIALDPYSSDGHDGLVDNGVVLNDETVDILAKMAVIQAQSGVDIVAPSDMMDGRVAAIRQALDKADLQQTMIMAYCAKYASAFYGPFRDALNSAPKAGDKKTYQMNPSNRFEAGMELDLDIAEGADIVMVKPATMYLDIVSDFKHTSSVPVAAYHVSGEYAMLKLAAAQGLIDYNQALIEVLVSIKRAGASLILSYGAYEAAQLLNQD
jgi:porphobilinogen synthase